VTYALEVAVEVQQVLYGLLPVELQELVLDKFELIAAGHDDRQSADHRRTSEVVTETAATRHYVFLTYVRDHAKRTVVIDSLGYVTRPV
jgi:hypothetical protein